MPVVYKIIGGDGREYGPATLEEIRGWCEDGRVGGGTPVWRDDELRWQPARNREELRWDLPQPPPIPQTAPSLPTASVVPSNVAPLSAGFAIRLAAGIYDLVIIQVLFSVLTSPWSEKLSAMNELMVKEINSGHPDWQRFLPVWLTTTSILLLTMLVYSVGFNLTQGATPGKRVLGLRVVKSDGTPLDWQSALLRFFAQCLSAVTFGFGFLLILLNPEDKALHDLIVGTRVISIRRA